MVEVKNIPFTVHAPCPSYLTAQVRKFYEVTFLQILLGDFLLEQNLTFVFTKTNKNKEISCMKSIKMHEKPHQNPMGF